MKFIVINLNCQVCFRLVKSEENLQKHNWQKQQRNYASAAAIRRSATTFFSFFNILIQLFIVIRIVVVRGAVVHSVHLEKSDEFIIAKSNIILVNGTLISTTSIVLRRLL